MVCSLCTAGGLVEIAAVQHPPYSHSHDTPREEITHQWHHEKQNQQTSSTLSVYSTINRRVTKNWSTPRNSSSRAELPHFTHVFSAIGMFLWLYIGLVRPTSSRRLLIWPGNEITCSRTAYPAYRTYVRTAPACLVSFPDPFHQRSGNETTHWSRSQTLKLPH